MSRAEARRRRLRRRNGSSRPNTTKQSASTCANHGNTKVPEDTFHGFAPAGSIEGTEIVLHRSMLCQWPDTHEVRLVEWDDADKLSEHPAHPIYALGADSKGTLW